MNEIKLKESRVSGERVHVDAGGHLSGQIQRHHPPARHQAEQVQSQVSSGDRSVQGTGHFRKQVSSGGR
jgi:hypothetical protein